MLSIVIPVYNEEESLESLHAQISEVADQHRYVLDIVFVDDGSTDGSWQTIQALSKATNTRGLRFRRNFGKAAALSAGFAAARGQYVMTMDADLQDDPQEIPRFLKAIDEDKVDVVSGWKQTRHDPWHKVWPSRVFNAMVSWLTGVKLHDHNCGFKCYRREVFDRMRLYGELHRFVPVLAAARGWRVGEVVVNHRARRHGKSKYGLLRIPKGFLDLLTVKFLTGFRQRPQHILGTVGLVSFIVGVAGLAWMTVWWFASRVVPGWSAIHLTDRAVFFYLLGAALLGGQFMSIGFLAELITAFHSREADTYSISEWTTGETQRAAGEGRSAGRLTALDWARSRDAVPVAESARTTVPPGRFDAPFGTPHISAPRSGDSRRDA